MRLLIGGGGTGGHLIPGIALYEAFSRRGHEALYVLRRGDLLFNASSRIAEASRLTVDLGRVSRKISFKTPSQLWSIFRAWREAFHAIKAFNPDAVLITGGYVSNVAALSAFLLGKPLFILEQNSAAGITNRFWAAYAKAVFTFFPEVKKIPAKKIVPAGNPLLYETKPSQSQGLAFFALDGGRKTLGVSGGSQGAKILNNLIFALLPKLGDYNIIWSLGTAEYERFAAEGLLDGLRALPRVKAFRFIDRMDCFWAASDGVLARAGAGTVSESLYFKTPALFIPIHGSPDDHQKLNAEYLAKAGAALILEEPELNPHSLELAIGHLFGQAESLKKSFPRGHPDPAGFIVGHVEQHLLP